MIPDPGPIHPLVARSGLLPRLVMQVAASAFFTIFYTPGGVAGWSLDLVLRVFETLRPSSKTGRHSSVT